MRAPSAGPRPSAPRRCGCSHSTPPARRWSRPRQRSTRCCTSTRWPRPTPRCCGALAAIPKPVGGLSILRGWWLGAALAGAGLAGAVVGALVLAVAAPPLLEQQALAWAEQQPTIFDGSYLGENGL